MGQRSEILTLDRAALQEAASAPGECAARWSGLVSPDIIPEHGEGATSPCGRQDCEWKAGAPCRRLVWLAKHFPDRPTSYADGGVPVAGTTAPVFTGPVQGEGAGEPDRGLHSTYRTPAEYAAAVQAVPSQHVQPTRRRFQPCFCDPAPQAADGYCTICGGQR